MKPLEFIKSLNNKGIWSFTAGGLLKSAKKFPLPVVQRGGYILERLGFSQGLKR